MTFQKLAKYEARAQVIKALAHPARLLVVDVLSRSKERCVCELTEMIGADILSMPTGQGIIMK